MKFGRIPLVMICCYIIGVYIFDFNEYLTKILDLLFVLLSFIFLAQVAKTKRIHLPIFVVISILFSLFCFISIIWALDSTLSIGKAITVILLSALLITLYNIMTNFEEECFEKIATIICISGALLSIYVLCFYGVDFYINGLNNNIRMGSELTNVNHIGYLASISIVADLFFILVRKKYKYILLLIPTILVALGTGSKKVILAVIVGVLLIYFYQLFVKKKIKKVLQLLLVVLLGVVIISLPTFNVMRERVLNAIGTEDVVDGSTLKRKALINSGLKAFSERPLAGVGVNNSYEINSTFTGYYLYSHNNYVELLVDTGIIGFSLYYSLFIILIIKLMTLVKNKDDFAALFSIMIISIMILDIGLVSYDKKIIYILLAIGFSYIYWEKINSSKNKNVLDEGVM